MTSETQERQPHVLKRAGMRGPIPEGAVLVARPSRWGNPFDVKRYGREGAVQLFEERLQWLLSAVPAAAEEYLAPLRGRNLVCYCHGPDETEPACHADVLLQYANREATGMTGYISNHVSLAQVRHSRPKKIWYGAQTCWWTHDARDLCREPASGLPCDPRGGMLFVTDDPQAFLDAAEANPEQYGKHGLRAFMAAHNRNCQVSILDMRATCFRSWDEYNALLDAQREAPPNRGSNYRGAPLVGGGGTASGAPPDTGRAEGSRRMSDDLKERLTEPSAENPLAAQLGRTCTECKGAGLRTLRIGIGGEMLGGLVGFEKRIVHCPVCQGVGRLP